MYNSLLKVMKWQMAPDMIKMPQPILVVPWNLLSQCQHHLGCSHFKWSMIVGAKCMRHLTYLNVQCHVYQENLMKDIIAPCGQWLTMSLMIIIWCLSRIVWIINYIGSNHTSLFNARGTRFIFMKSILHSLASIKYGSSSAARVLLLSKCHQTEHLTLYPRG